MKGIGKLQERSVLAGRRDERDARGQAGRRETSRYRDGTSIQQIDELRVVSKVSV